MADEAVKTVEHYIEGPRKPVLQEKQVFLVSIANIKLDDCYHLQLNENYPKHGKIVG